MEAIYVNGKKNGKATLYDTKGKIWQEGNFVNDKQDGNWKAYKNGKFVGDITY